MFTTLLCLALAAAPEGEDRGPRKPPPTAAEIAELPPDGGEEFNRLVFEKSPYLLQHARNPVDWYPWGEAAFERAARENKPVFLSVGYSTCHWCHVMEHESFEDAEVAALLNEHFVCVKVDREERPDVDQVYMSVTQAMTGRGGWPMTVVMTPEKKPFFAGTYFPKVGRGGRGGMMDLVPALAEAWRTQRSEIDEHAAKVATELARRTSGTPGDAPGEKLLARAASDLAGRYDPQMGGFGQAPKFPVPHNLRFLLRWARRSGSEAALEMVTTTLREMRAGGIWDHVGHGFHRYSTDRRWLVPHFEKMLYDQALIAMAYTEAWQVTGDPALRRTAEEIYAYVLRDMTSPEGAFYSAEDADSEGEEGLFYVWTLAELAQVLGEDDARVAAAVWNATGDGNFAEEATGRATGRNILHRTRPLAESAAELGMAEAELAQRLEGIRAKLFDHREARIHPLKDDKVLTDWNGLMIAALAKSALAFDEPRYRIAAERAAGFVLANLRDEDGRLLKRWRQGEAAFDGMLEDYAFLVWGLVELYGAGGDARWLREAVALEGMATTHFYDAEKGGYFTAPDDGEALIVRAKEIYDGALPSGNSVMVGNLLRLGRLTGNTEYDERADATMRAFAGDLRRSPSIYSQLLCALDFQLGPTFEVVVAADPAADDTRRALAALGRPFAPNKVVLLRPTGDAPAIVELAPYAADQRERDGKPTLYLCRDFACEAPTHDVDAVVARLREHPAGGDGD